MIQNHLIRSLTVVVLFWLSVPVFSVAQNSQKDSVDQEQSDTGIILDPVASASVYYDDASPDYGLENGIFIGRSFIGFEVTLSQSDSDIYGSFFGGFAESRDSDSFFSGAWVTGVSIGKQFYLNDRLAAHDQNNVDFYFRTGPGLGLAGRGTLLGTESNYHVGLNGNAILGAQLNISERTSFYMQGGGRFLWYPSLDEIGLLGVPMVSAGFRFNLTSDISPVRY